MTMKRQRRPSSSSSFITGCCFFPSSLLLPLLCMCCMVMFIRCRSSASSTAVLAFSQRQRSCCSSSSRIRRSILQQPPSFFAPSSHHHLLVEQTRTRRRHHQQQSSLILFSTLSTTTSGDDGDRGTTRSTTHSMRDDSSASKSRPSFSMPVGSPDDSAIINNNNNNSKQQDQQQQDNLAWNQLGLYTELVDSLSNQMQLVAPTKVQQLVIPELLQPNFQHFAFLAATGSGKTLAYCLPLMQQLKQQEMFSEDHQDNLSSVKRPRMVVLAPTRELVLQILQVVKTLSHSIKLSSVALASNEDYGKQRKKLGKHIDIVIATPGRLLKHWKDQNVFLGSTRYIVLDEMDTMLEQGFKNELKQIMYPVLYHKQANQDFNLDEIENVDDNTKVPRVILTSATMTQAIQKMIGDTDSNNNAVNAKKHYRKRDEEDGPAGRGGEKSPPLVLPKMKVIKAPGLHKAVPRLKQTFVDVGSTDKMSLVVDIISSGGSGSAISTSKSDSDALTMVFCNTVASCRAVEFALSEARIDCLSYHGELNSQMRTDNLNRFRRAGLDDDDFDSSQDPRVLVCTDLAARGLDVPQVDHVIMFDFPLNALDYLHRSGRTARGIGGGGGQSSSSSSRQGNGRVTALVSKRDRVLANAIERAVQRGEPLDGLSSRKSDYQPGGRLNKGGGGGGGVSSKSRGGGSRASRTTVLRVGGKNKGKKSQQKNRKHTSRKSS